MAPTFFPKQSHFRKWLEENHDQCDELWVGYYKKKTGIESITWPQSVDEALCFGWIDGIRKSIDESRYMIRFTPRRPRSIWSAVNIKRAKELIEMGLMAPPGKKTFAKRDDERSKKYSYEQKNARLSKEYREKIKANEKAWAFFQKLAPSYKKASVWWVMSAKREETRQRRLNTLIESSAEGRKIPQLRIGKKDK